MKRHKTTYAVVLYQHVARIGGRGLERAYYIIFQKDGKVFETEVGRQFPDNIDPGPGRSDEGGTY